MSKASKDSGIKKVHLLRSNEDKGSDLKKVGFNIATGVVTSTGASGVSRTGENICYRDEIPDEESCSSI